MTIELYNNASPPEKISKSISLVATLTGSMRNDTNIVKPRIIIESATLPEFNYAKITSFNRYYYLRDIVTIRTTIFELELESDVLMSFNLNGVTGIVEETQNNINNYLEHRHFVRNVKSKTDILTFSGGLLDTGEYILITAGGGA